MRKSSATHLVLIPSYNPGPKVFDTVRAALDQWSPVWIVVDGSTDGSTPQLLEMASTHPGMRVLVCPQNRGIRRAVWGAFSWPPSARRVPGRAVTAEG